MAGQADDSKTGPKIEWLFGSKNKSFRTYKEMEGPGCNDQHQNQCCKNIQPCSAGSPSKLSSSTKSSPISGAMSCDGVESSSTARTSPYNDSDCGMLGVSRRNLGPQGLLEEGNHKPNTNGYSSQPEIDAENDVTMVESCDEESCNIDYLNDIILYCLKRVAGRAKTLETKSSVLELRKTLIQYEIKQPGLSEAISEEIWLRMASLKEGA